MLNAYNKHVEDTEDVLDGKCLIYRICTLRENSIYP